MVRWRGRRQSDNIEDRRGQRAPRRAGFGIPIPRSGAGKAGGIGGIGFIIFIIVLMVMGVDPAMIFGGGGGQAPATYDAPLATTAEDEALKDFVAVILADTEEVWPEIMRGIGQTYREPNLVLFSGAVESACGYASAAVGPFYCPGDQKVYIDLSFFKELGRKFGAPGDFAQAYVIAHEVGHHVQTLLGISNEVRRAQSRVSKTEANALQVRMELQADCFSGLWANRADRKFDILEAGDIEEGLRAAEAIGDDTLQKRSQGYVVPDAFTHGTSEQRMRWFTRGYEAGDINACDTFAAERL